MSNQKPNEELRDAINAELTHDKIAVRVSTDMADRTVSIPEAAQIVAAKTEAKGVWRTNIMPSKFENWVENSYNHIRDVFKVTGKAKVYVGGKDAIYVMETANFEEALPEALGLRKKLFQDIANEISANWDEFAAECVKKMGNLEKRNKAGKRYFKYNNAKEYFGDFRLDIRPVPIPVEATITADMGEFAMAWMERENAKTRMEMYAVPVTKLVDELDKFIFMLDDSSRSRYSSDTCNKLDAALSFAIESCAVIPAVAEIRDGLAHKGKPNAINIRRNLDKLMAEPEKMKDDNNRKKMLAVCTLVRDKLISEVING